VVGFCGAPHPLRPYLRRGHGIRQPLPLRTAVPPQKPWGRGPTSGENTCRKLRAKEEWIPIPVPPIVDEETRRLAQAQLERNARLSFRNNKKYSYLLRCLLSCQSCNLAMFGVTYKATDTQPERRYYQCHGKDPILSAREHKCTQRPAKANELEEAVWEHVKGLMRDPERLLSQFEQFAHSGSANDDKEDAEAKKFEAHLKRLSREQTRLVDAYQAGIIELEELQERRTKIAQRREALRTRYDQQARLRRQAAQAREMLEDLQAFCGRIDARLDEATFEEKQTILQLLIERIIVGEGTLEIRHVIPLDGPPRSSRGSLAPPGSGLRSDGVYGAPLPLGAGQLACHRGLYALVIVRDHQPHSRKASVDEAPQQRGVGRSLLRGGNLNGQHLPKAFLVHPHAHQKRHAPNPHSPANLQVGGVQVQIGVFLLLQRTLPPLPLLLFEPTGDAAYGVLADPYLAQGIGDPGYLPDRDP
jgi:hypothetical protein